MKQIAASLVFYFFTYLSFAQNVGIGTTTPNASAQLEVNSTTKGLLIPRMTTSQMNTIAGPASGLVIYNTDDSSYYTRRLTSWQKMTYGDDNLWKRYNNNIYSLAGNYVGINYNTPNAQAYVGNYAPLQSRGVIGNTLALFGEDRQGISFVANYPGIFFNSYYNGGVKSIVTGGTGNIILNQANPHYYEFSFGDYATGSDQVMTNTVGMALRNDGHLYLGNNSINFSRAGIEQQGTVGTTAAIFGGEGSGISLQKDWPAIGLNHWYDGVSSKSIGAGYAAQIGVDQTNGAFFISNFPTAASTANETLGSSVTKFYVRNGKLGIRNNNPIANIDITQLDGDLNTFSGVKFNENGIYWNLFARGPSPNEWFNFALNGTTRSYINGGGAYIQLSDSNFKKNIASLNAPEMLQKIKLLNPVTYNFKEEKDEQQINNYGFLSQEVSEIFPALISNNQGVKMMNYSGLIPILTKGIQEQQTEIETLKTSNQLLEVRIKKLEDIVSHSKNNSPDFIFHF